MLDAVLTLWRPEPATVTFTRPVTSSREVAADELYGTRAWSS